MNRERAAGPLSDIDLERELKAALLMDASGRVPHELRAAVAAIRDEHPAVDARHGRHPTSTQILSGLSAAAVLALLAVGLPWLIGPRSGLNPGGEEPTPTPTVFPSVSTPSPSAAALIHAQRWFLSFDYPATWTLTDRNVQIGAANAFWGSDGSVLGFVGNGSAEASCTRQEGQVSWWTETTCTTTWRLVDNSIVIRFERVSSLSDTPPTHWTSLEVLAGAELPGSESLTIDGLPARLAKSTTSVVPYTREPIPGASEVLWWGLPSQTNPGNGWEIVAAIRGPDVAEMEAQAKAMVGGIHFVPETVMLPTDPQALRQAGVTALAAFARADKADANDEHNLEYDCFPHDVGSRKSTITQNPFTSPLTEPLPVTCAIESIEPNAMQGLTLVMSQSWDAGRDYPAGAVRWTISVLPDGGVLGGGIIEPDLKSFSGPLYPHIGPSKYAA